MPKHKLPTIHYLPKNAHVLYLQWTTYSTISTTTYLQYANYNELNYCIHVILKSVTFPTMNYLQ